MGSNPDDIPEAGFAKLKGLEFEFYMQAYSILLGRNSKNSPVDLDLFFLGGGKDISRHHARIFYDFERHHFAMEILGRKGCIVQGFHHFPDELPVKLNSQDHIFIGDLEFYFLLPSKGIIPFRGKHCLATTTTSKGKRMDGANYTCGTSLVKKEEEEDNA